MQNGMDKRRNCQLWIEDKVLIDMCNKYKMIGVEGTSICPVISQRM